MAGATLSGADLRDTDLMGAVGSTPSKAAGACTDDATVVPEHVAADVAVGCPGDVDQDDGDTFGRGR